MVRKINTNNGKLNLTDEIETIYEKKITKFGTGAKIDAPKECIGKKIYVLIRKDNWVYDASISHQLELLKQKLLYGN